jgi:hypothetical protein
MVWEHDNKYSKEAIQGNLSYGVASVPLDFKWIARTGEWNLYEAKWTPGPLVTINGLAAGATVSVSINKHPSLANEVVFIDDVRYQPLDAQVVCYVYDAATLKPLATFDDQHFGMYNQYDGEGKLVRKLIETERGIRTVQESQIHAPNQIRE